MNKQPEIPSELVLPENDSTDYRITSNYDWCVRAFRTTRKFLKLNIKLHDQPQQSCQQAIAQGDIFLFNHFARFETFIPQFLIHTESGSYCRSIASHEFFAEDRFAGFLRSIGVVPNNMPGLFPFLAREILHGRKLIVFPEGGMVKDKRVVDHKGRFGVYSRTAMERRKHHRGAAVIALALDAFKTALLRDFSKGNYDRVEKWSQQLGFDDSEQLLIRALKPTTIIPSNITFYPIRVSNNFLHAAMQRFGNGINRRFAEELLVEGNLLFKHTDMDIRFASPMIMGKYWKWWEKYLLPNVVHRFESLDELFNLTPESGHWGGRIHSIGMKAKSNLVRDDYMQAMYKATTVNMSHIASYIIVQCYLKGIIEIDSDRFNKTLYVCIKRIQQLQQINLHRSLLNPAEYDLLLEGGSQRLDQFKRSVEEMGLFRQHINEQGKSVYSLLPKLRDEFHIDQIRTENLISVYANEIAPLSRVTKLIHKSFSKIDQVDELAMAEFRFNDEILAYQWDKKAYNKPRHHEINRLQKMTQDGNWFHMKSEEEGAPGVMLVHGFLASPAEMRSLGDRFAALGFHVIGVRLKGHGTSPWDLRDCDWQDWARSVKTGFRILRAYCDDVHLVGFSTGGLLCLHQASENNDPSLRSVVAISAPVEFHNRNLKFVPILHKANKFVRWVSSEGLMPFRPNDSEHPDINYVHIPIRALYQLQKFITHLQSSTLNIDCAVSLLQSDKDPVVKPTSAQSLYQLINSPQKTIEMLNANRHGVVYEDLDHCQQKIIDVVIRHTEFNQIASPTEHMPLDPVHSNRA